MYKQTRILAHLQAFRAAKPGPFWATAAVAALSPFVMVAAFGTAPSTVETQAPQQTVVEQLSAPSLTAVDEADGPFVHEARVIRGDTVAGLLSRLGVRDDAASRFLRHDRAARTAFQRLRTGSTVTAHVDADGKLQTLRYPLDNEHVLLVERRGGHFEAGKRPIQLNTRVVMKSGMIHHSLISAAHAAGVPERVAIHLTNIFAGKIDFRRDLRRGDQFSVIYKSLTHFGKPVRAGRILAAQFVNRGKVYRAFWFADANHGNGGYYDAHGRSLQEAFLRYPLRFTRISSPFSARRFDPVLHSWHPHRGVDLAAPIGTPVKAASDGVIHFAGFEKGFGRVVILRYSRRYTTLYAHLSRFAHHLHRGVHVTEGQVIGYVGESGWATGPHLHYEFHVNGVPKNPVTVRLPGEPPLSAKQLARFKTQMRPELAELDRIEGSTLASAQ